MMIGRRSSPASVRWYSPAPRAGSLTCTTIPASSSSFSRFDSSVGDMRGTPLRKSLKRLVAAQQFAQQQRRPARADDFRRHGHRAELSVTRLIHDVVSVPPEDGSITCGGVNWAVQILYRQSKRCDAWSRRLAVLPVQFLHWMKSGLWIDTRRHHQQEQRHHDRSSPQNQRPKPISSLSPKRLGQHFAANAAAADEADCFVADNYKMLKASGLVEAGVPRELGGGGADRSPRWPRCCGCWRIIAARRHWPSRCTRIRWRFRPGAGPPRNWRRSNRC